MYLREIRVQNLKLLRDVDLSFTDESDAPRMWTVFVGENRLCKTSLLQAIAVAAAGVDRGTQLFGDVAASWQDVRTEASVEIEAVFEFSGAYHGARSYPGLEPEVGGNPPRLRSSLSLAAGKRVFGGGSTYDPPSRMSAGEVDPLTTARIAGLGHWFVAGYGPTRRLPSPGGVARSAEPSVDRLRPLFGESLIGTGFIDLFEPDLSRAYAETLRAVLVHGGLLPHISGLELRGRGGIRTAHDLTDAQRFIVDLGANNPAIKIPATWLSQGYQSVIAWLADVVGQIFLEAGEASGVSAARMEGLVLVDEIDVHLHPTWQVRLIPALKRVFPKIQFIATTHSPMILPALHAGEVFLISQGEDGSVRADAATRSPALLTGTELYRTFFGLDDLYPKELGRDVRRYGEIATDPMRSDADDALAKNLRARLAAQGITFDWDPVAREASS